MRHLRSWVKCIKYIMKLSELFNLCDFNKSGKISQDELVCVLSPSSDCTIWGSGSRFFMFAMACFCVQTVLFMSACYSFLAFCGKISGDVTKLKQFESRCESMAIAGCASVYIFTPYFASHLSGLCCHPSWLSRNNGECRRAGAMTIPLLERNSWVSCPIRSGLSIPTLPHMNGVTLPWHTRMTWAGITCA